MSLRIPLTLILLIPVWVFAQSPRVPSRMEFAGIKLRIMEDARNEIQKDVNALTKSPKYFNIKVERAKTYFPIIERVFREEGLHDDFKYLVLQESALIPDAVSVSNAVGFWQFKDFTAMEVGLRVDKHVDERMNIEAASRGAAKYMKRNNEFFDNWLHALQAYQMGAGGAMRALGKGSSGAKSMVINKKTYWYVKKYLAHKVAFEGAVSGPGETRLVEYHDGKDKTLKEISDETGVSLEQLQDYNKWLKRGKIPDDKAYTVVLPVSKLDNIQLAVLESEPKMENRRQIEYHFPVRDNFPEIEDFKEARKGHVVEINDLPGIIGAEGDKIIDLARKGDVDLSKFLKYNDIQITDPIIDGQVYYYKKKKAKAQAHYYVAQPGETLWSISQKFGLRLKKLMVKNRISEEKELQAGRVLWLRYIRPARVDIEYKKVVKPPVKEVPENSENIYAEKLTEKEKVEKEMAVAKPEIKEDKVHVPAQKDSVFSKGIDNKPGTVLSVSGQEAEVSVLGVTGEEEEYVNEETEGNSGDEYVEEDEEKEEYHVQNIHKVHIVQPGQTLYSISKLYNVTVTDLLEWNKLKINDKLSINQKLLIMESPNMENLEAEQKVKEKNEEKVSEESYSYHTVNQGDTIYKIARSYNVTIEELMTWNDKEDFSISLGERIKIKKKQSN
ncbi:LysM peptidoglycan-binding domain-containing protein [Fulvivirga sp. 29W222]|uniref:LysM peptidoglycan-binding domain-containing protein n=1 Tax=Fulvivirga marina TaxID=2494733 RepID=A0A937KCG8_9BACT|nr:LysM peptidoglycan-binding domain-containing protein [Fulvivirga marina]MBL6447364.1 LysM peptidoglycan-binding domain-containing protein [Fulvivirga marina]